MPIAGRSALASTHRRCHACVPTTGRCRMSLTVIEEQPDTGSPVAHVDVLIVGAGVSGIGCAYHLQTEQPGESYVILEAREATGGTWDLFRYPGIRSDSDLHTFGYEFKPWVDEKAIVGGPSILRYIRETASENGIDSHRT